MMLVCVCSVWMLSSDLVCVRPKLWNLFQKKETEDSHQC